MDRECSIWLKGKGVLTEKDHQYGSWLRASTPNLARKTVVKVAGLEDEDPIVGDQSHDTDSDDGEGLLERVNGGHSMAGSDAHKQGDSEGTRSGFFEGSSVRGKAVYEAPRLDLIPNDPKLISSTLVDSELPTMEGIGTHRRIPESDFQVQLDAIDTELTKFDTGKDVGVDCGIGQEHHVDVNNGADLNSSKVEFVKDSDGFSQQQGSSIGGTGRARVSKRPKRLIDEDSVMTKGSKRSVLSKRSHKEVDPEVGTEVVCKKSRNANTSELSVEAGFQPRREQ
nr:hypothetical protein CFP56_49504 [Quercus suber]